jgi:hypothetical protein
VTKEEPTTEDPKDEEIKLRVSRLDESMNAFKDEEIKVRVHRLDESNAFGLGLNVNASAFCSDSINRTTAKDLIMLQKMNKTGAGAARGLFLGNCNKLRKRNS